MLARPALVAQGIERRTPKPGVAGSNPAGGTNRIGTRWFTVPEAVAYGLADEVIGGPAGAPESGTPA